MKYYILFLMFFIILIQGCTEDNGKLGIESDLELIELEVETTNFVLDKPWESEGIGYINVIQENSIWHLWYESFFSKSTDHPDYSGALCYAYSNDGMNWVKPKLKLHTFYGEETNIIFKSNIPKEGLHGVGITKVKDGVYNYKMVYSKLVGNNSDAPTRIFMMDSKDGINWENERMVLDHASDTQNILQKKDNNYYLFFRNWSGGIHAVGKRQIAYVKSKELNFKTEDIKILEINGSTLPSSGQYYNSSIKIINDNFVLFPTVYNPNLDESRIEVAEGEDLNSLNVISTNNLSISKLDTPFRIVAPQIVSVGQDSISEYYYIYYFERNTGHNNTNEGEIIRTIGRSKIVLKKIK